jgi:hypothetical protein
MEQLSRNARFNSSLNKLSSFKREKVYNNIEKLINKNPDINSIIYIAILDKLYKKDTSCLDIGAGTYMSAVDTWNKFIYDSGEDFDLLISGEDLVF